MSDDETAAPPYEAYLDAVERIVADRGLYQFDFAKAEFFLSLTTVQARARTIARDSGVESGLRSISEMAARELIGEVADELGPEVAKLIGQHRRTRRMTRAQRRTSAAFERGLTSEHSGRYYAATHEPSAVRQLAQALYRLEALGVLQLMRSGEEVSDLMAIDWMRRQTYYYRMSIQLWGLQADLSAFLDSRAKGSPNSAFVNAALYRFTAFAHAYNRFVDERAGMWIFRDADRTDQIAKAAYQVLYNVKIPARDQSFLVTGLVEAPEREMDPFLSSLEASQRGQALMSSWSEWVHSCACEALTHTAACQVGLVMDGCQTYATLVDEDWFDVLGWYREPPATIKTGTEYEAFRERFGEPLT